MRDDSLQTLSYYVQGLNNKIEWPNWVKKSSEKEEALDCLIGLSRISEFSRDKYHIWYRANTSIYWDDKKKLLEMISKKEIKIVSEFCKKLGVESSECTHWANGGKGTKDLANKVVKTCKKSLPEDPPENSAFIQIWDTKIDKNEEKIFSGWMFSSSPSISAVDHAVYDVWVIDCNISYIED